MSSYKFLKYFSFCVDTYTLLCYNKIGEINMKKISAAVLSLILLFCFCGCTVKNDSQNEQYAQLLQKIEEIEAALDAQSKNVDKLTEELEFYKRQIDNLRGAPIQYIAEKPLFELTAPNRKLLYIVKNPTENIFATFKNYYKNTFNRGFIGFIPNGSRNLKSDTSYYAVYSETENSTDKFLALSRIGYYDPVIGMSGKDNPDGISIQTDCITDQSFYLLPQTETAYLNLCFLEFGQLDQPWLYVNYRNYCNIYMYDECIATCYFHLNGYMSYDYFESFILSVMAICQ